MRGDRSSRDIGPILSHWMDAVAPARPPERLLEEAFARTMTSRQRPLHPWHRLRLGGGQGLSSRRLGGVALAGVALVLVTALATGLLPRFGQGIADQPSPTPSPSASPSPSLRPTPSGPPFPSPVSVRSTAEIAVSAPITIASDGTSIWIFTASGDLVRIDPLTNTVAATVQMRRPTNAFQSLAGNETGLWVTDFTAREVLRFDPVTLASVTAINPGAAPKGVLVKDGAVWIANLRGGSVARIDPATNKVVATVAVGPTGTSGPNWLAEGLGSIWVGIPNAGIVSRISETTNKVEATIPVTSPASPCGGMATGTSAVWITSCDGGNLVTQIDPVTNTVAGTIDLGAPSYTIAMIADRPWTSPEGGQILRIDPVSHAVDRVVTPGPGFVGGGDVVVAAGSLWVLDGPSNRVLRLPIAAFGG